MRGLVFVCSSNQTHIDIVVISKSARFHGAEHIANHKSIVLAKSFYLSLKAV